MRPVLSLAAALLAVPAVAQSPVQSPARSPASPPAALPGRADTKLVAAGTYKVEPRHTQVTFAVDHFGITIFRGEFAQASGSLTIDPAAPTGAALSVTIPVASVHTSDDKLTAELAGADWFDAARYPQASFVSTKVTPGPNGMARVDGNLTLHGVTKPATMTVRFHGAAPNPMNKTPTIGFDGRMAINRSDFGVTKLLNLVSDHVELTIAGAFEKVG